MKIFIITIICAVFSTCSGYQVSKPWDYFVFTQEWPGTFCQYSDCNFPSTSITGWNIHGLWPSNSEGKDPYNCDPALPFNINSLQSIYQRLQTQWADLKSFDNPNDFWKHEWTKHGTCAIEDPLLPNELGYFSTGLSLKLKTNLDISLQNAGIVPSSSNQYNENTVTEAIKNTLQITPVLRCVTYQGQLYLSAIEICAYKNLTLRNCYKSSRSDINISKEFLAGVFKNARLSLTGQYSSTPVNAPCHDAPFILPLITESQVKL